MADSLKHIVWVAFKNAPKQAVTSVGLSSVVLLFIPNFIKIVNGQGISFDFDEIAQTSVVAVLFFITFATLNFKKGLNKRAADIESEKEEAKQAQLLAERAAAARHQASIATALLKARKANFGITTFQSLLLDLAEYEGECQRHLFVKGEWRPNTAEITSERFPKLSVLYLIGYPIPQRGAGDFDADQPVPDEPDLITFPDTMVGPFGDPERSKANARAGRQRMWRRAVRLIDYYRSSFRAELACATVHLAEARDFLAKAAPDLLRAIDSAEPTGLDEAFHPDGTLRTWDPLPPT